jgi:hypothetical protein
MRTKRYLPRIQNGSVVKRQTRSKNPATSRAFSAQKSVVQTRSRVRPNQIGAGSNAEGGGSRVMWLMLMVGIGLSAVFVFALRSQINAYQLGRAEEQLREKLDQYAAQQKFLTLDQQRALNTSESDRAGRAGGLNQLKLDQQSAMHAPSVGKAVHQNSDPVRQDPEPVGQNSDSDKQSQAGQKGNHQEVPRSIKQPSKPSQNGPSQNVKAAGTAKAVKVMKVVKIMKPNAAKSSFPRAGGAKAGVPKASVASNRVKAEALSAKKKSDNQRQAARSHPRR